MNDYRLFYAFYDQIYDPLSKRGEERRVRTMELLKEYTDNRESILKTTSISGFPGL